MEKELNLIMYIMSLENNISNCKGLIHKTVLTAKLNTVKNELKLLQNPPKQYIKRRMKVMLIYNETDLSMSIIGKVIDNICQRYQGDTNYVGKIDIIEIEVNDRHLKITISYMKQFTKWLIEEVIING